MVIGVTMVKWCRDRKTVTMLCRSTASRMYIMSGEFDFVVIIEVEGLSMLNKLLDVIRE